jgi:glycosyltransferase involved in cell wall biosynthesis
MNPKISIITPVYNGEKLVEETISSVLKQSYKDWEMVIMDGGSTDATVAIAKKYSEQCSQIKVYSEKDEGLWDAIDKAFDIVKGEFLCFLCVSDGYINNRWYEECIEVFDKHPEVSMVWGIPIIKSEDGKIVGPHFAYAHFLKEKPKHSRLSALSSLAKRTREGGARSFFQKLNAFNANTFKAIIVEESLPIKEEWFRYWLETGHIYPDGNMMVRKDVFFDCVPRYDRKHKVIDKYLEFFFNFNTKGYFSYGLPIEANYATVNEGHVGEKYKERIARDRMEYLDKLKRFKKEFFKGKGTFQFIDHNKKIVSEIKK